MLFFLIKFLPHWTQNYFQLACVCLAWQQVTDLSRILNSSITLLQSSVTLHTSSWKRMSMCESSARNSRSAAAHTTPTSTTTSPGSTPPSRSVWSAVAILQDWWHWWSALIHSPILQKVTVEERARSQGENGLDIQSILTISAVDLADTGNITCIGTNEAGENSTTTYLLVVGKPQACRRPASPQNNRLSVTLSELTSLMTDKPYIRLLPQLSLKLAHKGLAVEVNEGEDLELNVVVEAYPDITEHRWHTPTSHRTSTQEHKLVKYNNRYGRGLFFSLCIFVE